MNKLMEDFAKKLDKKDLKIVFGLEAQGHIPTIEKILDDLGSNDYAWEKIGKEIGWCDKTARNHYITYLREKYKKYKKYE
jgi:hypothetical protein